GQNTGYIYRNTEENKQKNSFCLEEIFIKMNTILKKQIEISNFCSSHKYERQLLFQNIYDLKKQIVNTAFNSLIDKDITKCFVKIVEDNEMKNNVYKKSCLGKDNEKRKPNHDNLYLFLLHLNQLERSAFTFAHFLRNVSLQIYPAESPTFHATDQKIFSFLQDPHTVRIIRKFEKNITKIKTVCTQTYLAKRTTPT
ncbi:conserved Plasmodium protein, unknown function, partial [Plasmodium ovale]